MSQFNPNDHDLSENNSFTQSLTILERLAGLVRGRRSVETMDQTQTPTTSRKMSGEETDIRKMSGEETDRDQEHQGTTEQSKTVTESPLSSFIKVF